LEERRNVNDYTVTDESDTFRVDQTYFHTHDEIQVSLENSFILRNKMSEISKFLLHLAKFSPFSSRC